MPTPREALAELTEEIGLLEGAARLVDELRSSREVAGLEEQVGRLQRAAESLASSDRVLRSLAGAGSGAAEFLLGPEITDRLSEIQESLAGVEEECDSLRDALEEVAATVESLLDEQIDSAESLQAQLLESQEAVEASFVALAGGLETTRDSVLAEAAERTAALAETVKELVEEQFKDLPEEVASAVEEALEEAVKELGGRLTEAATNLTGLAESAFADLKDHAESGVRDAVEEEVTALADSAIEALAREAVESLGLSQLSAAATSAMSPILPQLIAIRIVVNGLKRALEIMRLGL